MPLPLPPVPSTSGLSGLPRLAQAEAAAHTRYGQHPGGSVELFGPLVAVHDAPDSPLNSAWHDGTRPPTPQELTDFGTYCAAHGQRPTLHLLSHAAPTLLPLLGERGYTLTSVLHAYLHDLLARPAQPLPVQETTDAPAWAAVCAAGFGPGSEAIMRRVAQTPGTRLFLAGPPDGPGLGAAALSVTTFGAAPPDGRAGVAAALHGTSTRPEHRGQGAQTALLAARLNAAAQAGADLTGVFVTPGTPSERNVVRAGFRLAGLRLTFSA
ncbi:GNAT family N-acetyltransferase [Deinococcus depolymerans]|uniref:N-acetyltransferase domain-containing protein n=1 Tax=Deinococcus depolymerans TaxID=392408 RepID=A0ABN1BRT0_9DEIO